MLLPNVLGSFHVETWCCRLDSRFVIESSIETIASVIVHEAAHARLFRAGVKYDEEIRSRVEAICVGEQARFAAKIPSGDDLKPAIEASLKLDASTWTNESFEKRRLRGSIDALRYLGSPSWFINLVLRRYRRARRRSRQAAAI